MASLHVPVRKLWRLLDYLETIGIDAEAVAEKSHLSYQSIFALDKNALISKFQYSVLYQNAAQQMQSMGKSLPWAAGVGTDAFRLMCYCMVSSKTLGIALQRAADFERLLMPQIGHRVDLIQSNGTAKLTYIVQTEKFGDTFAPEHWDRSPHLEAVSKSSGLEVWYALCGWLVAKPILLQSVSISAPYVSKNYEKRLQSVFQCQVAFNAEETAFCFDAAMLDYRLVHTSESMDKFLQSSLYQLWEMDHRPVSTSAAIKSLIGTNFRDGIPSLEEMAENMHMSVSTLRRYLTKENTSYQKLKDESRRQVAIELLCSSDMKMADISDQLGFSDTSSFIRSFRGWTNVTPKVFRETMTNTAVSSKGIEST